MATLEMSYQLVFPDGKFTFWEDQSRLPIMQHPRLKEANKIHISFDHDNWAEDYPEGNDITILIHPGDEFLYGHRVTGSHDGETERLPFIMLERNGVSSWIFFDNGFVFSTTADF